MNRFTLDRCPSHCERLTECYRRPPAPSSPGFHHVASELVSIGHCSRSLSKEAGGEGSRSHGKDKNTAFVAKPAQNTGANPAHPCRPCREHPKSPDSPTRPPMHRRLQIIVSKTPYRNREYANMRGEPCSYRHAQSSLFFLTPTTDGEKGVPCTEIPKTNCAAQRKWKSSCRRSVLGGVLGSPDHALPRHLIGFGEAFAAWLRAMGRISEQAPWWQAGDDVR